LLWSHDLADKTKTIRGVEILRTGTFDGLRGPATYTVEDLDGFVAAHEALIADGQDSIKVALGGKLSTIKVNTGTIGHNEHDKSGNVIREAPVIGRLSRMYREGERLLADVAEVPEQLAATILKAYPDRSIEAIRFRVDKGVEIAGKVYDKVITSLAFLGESLPAVGGLASLPKILQGRGDAAARVVAYGVDDSNADVVLVFSAPDAAADDLAAEEEPVDVDAMLAALDAWGEKATAAVRGKPGAPLVYARIRGLKEELRRIAGAKVITNSGGPMNREQILTLLGLAADAKADAVVTALAKDDPAVAETIVALAGGLEFADPAQFVAWLAGKLDVSPGDLGAIASAVASALGLTPDEGADGAATEGDPAAMSKADPKTTKDANGGETAEVVTLAQFDELKAEHVQALTRLAALEGKDATEQAERLVDGYLAAGKALPAQRETLVALAKQSPETVTKLYADAPVIVKFGERGTSGGGESTSEFEPTAVELQALVEYMGWSEAEARIAHINTKREEAGLPPLPKETK
jgi:hypothetical protein